MSCRTRFFKDRRIPSCLAVILFCLMPGICRATNEEPGNAKTPVKFGFTRSMFIDLNEGDARAAVKSYTLLLASNNDLSVSDSPGVLENAPEVADAFSKGTADIVSLTSIEYFQLPAGSTHPRLIAATMGHSIFEQYVLLVRNDSHFSSIADLQNKRLLIYSSLRGCLSPIWLDVLLATDGRDEASRFFGRITAVNKPSRTILPVFFKQADACIVTRNGFEAISELNPQIMKQMKIIAESPKLIPTITCFRSSITPAISNRIIKAVVNAQYTAAGQQVLTIFQSDSITEISAEQLDNVYELLTTQARLRQAATPTTANTAPKNELSKTAKLQ